MAREGPIVPEGPVVAENTVVPEGAASGETSRTDDDLFVPMRPFRAFLPGGSRDPGDPRARRERERERRIAEHVQHDRERRVTRPPQRGRGLSRDDIVEVAVSIADAEGTEAVSMRRVAREMRAGAMSLYWHVESKEELHQLMLEHVQNEAPAPVPSGDWRADLRAFACNVRATLLRHPWAIDFLGNGPPSGPSDARNAERLLGALDGLGVDPVTGVWIAMTIVTYAMGAVLREVREIRWQRAADEVKVAMTTDEIAGLMADFRQRLRKSGKYPHITALMDTGLDPDAPETREERFEFGLDCVLDGIAARIPGRG